MTKVATFEGLTHHPRNDREHYMFKFKPEVSDLPHSEELHRVHSEAHRRLFGDRFTFASHSRVVHRTLMPAFVALLSEEAARSQAGQVRTALKEGLDRLENALAAWRRLAWVSLIAAVIALRPRA